MTSPVEPWVAHVAAHASPASIRWLTDPAAYNAVLQDVPSERTRPPEPVTFMCARNRDQVSQTCEFLTRAEATARFWSAFRGSLGWPRRSAKPGRATRLRSPHRSYRAFVTSLAAWGYSSSVSSYPRVLLARGASATALGSGPSRAA